LNKDGAQLVAEAGAAAKRFRELKARGEQVQTELSQVRVDQAQAEAERDALRAAMQAQTKNLTAASAECEQMAGELAKLTARGVQQPGGHPDGSRQLPGRRRCGDRVHDRSRSIRRHECGFRAALRPAPSSPNHGPSLRSAHWGRRRNQRDRPPPGMTPFPAPSACMAGATTHIHSISDRRTQHA